LFHTDCAAGQLCQDRRCIDTDTCQNSLDCTEADRPICDIPRGRCVECVTPNDCEGDADCVANRCVPFDACRNSLDCPLGRVCNTSIGRCVDCVATPDCDMGERCVNNKCGPECVSDNQCTNRGMLCDLTNGVCVECLAHADCPDVYHCAAGACVLDACAVGSSTCEGNTRMVCRAVGDGYDTAPCAARQSCVAQNLTSRCEDWVCTAGVTECDATNQRLVTCSADGLRETNAVNCTATDQICYNGACRSLACPPNERFCEGEVLRQCASDGLSSTRRPWRKPAPRTSSATTRASLAAASFAFRTSRGATAPARRFAMHAVRARSTRGPTAPPRRDASARQERAAA
jgi:hypothetical protein